MREEIRLSRVFFVSDLEIIMPQSNQKTLKLSTEDRILRWPELLRKIGYCRTNVYYLTQKGEFPCSIKLGGRAVGWLESEINQWIQDRVSLSRHQEISDRTVNDSEAL